MCVLVPRGSTDSTFRGSKRTRGLGTRVLRVRLRPQKERELAIFGIVGDTSTNVRRRRPLVARVGPVPGKLGETLGEIEIVSGVCTPCRVPASMHWPGGMSWCGNVARNPAAVEERNRGLCSTGSHGSHSAKPGHENRRALFSTPNATQGSKWGMARPLPSDWSAGGAR